MEKEFPNSSHAAYAQYAIAEAVLSNPKAPENELALARQKVEAVIQSAPKQLANDAFQGRAGKDLYRVVTLSTVCLK